MNPGKPLTSSDLTASPNSVYDKLANATEKFVQSTMAEVKANNPDMSEWEVAMHGMHARICITQSMLTGVFGKQAALERESPQRPQTEPQLPPDASPGAQP